MGRFDQSGFAEQAASPAAPTGLKEAAGAAAGAQAGDPRFADSALAERYADPNIGGVGTAQSWYTGANTQGTINGWNTDFWDRTMAAQEKAAAMGKMNTQFEDPDLATGVVTWDHESTDGMKQFKFGDIYDNGRYEGNVFDQFGEQTASLMMADVLFDPKTKAEMFQDVEIDPSTQKITNDGGTAQAVQAKREENNTQIPKALSAADFQQGVDERADEFEEGWQDEAIVGGGVAGGAAVGAGVGAIFGGVGAIPGAILGGAAGGIGAWLNQDSLVEQAARATEITAMSDRENGTGAAIATGVNQWAGFGAKLVAPGSNIIQGTYDAQAGTVGDGESEFYRTDEAGDRKAPTWMKVADVTASVGDMALQFASPIGVMLYTTQMSATIGGEVAELGLTGGETFDYQRGGFDNIFTDDKGDFAPDQAMAGIGKIGIDVIQLGFARGLTGKVQAGRQAVGQKMVGEAGPGVLSRIGARIYGKGTQADEVGRVAGSRFTRNAAGDLERRSTLSLLAPSEQLTALSARVLGMRMAAKRGGSYTADDFYAAAQALSAGEKKWTTALVNGMGEGYEEAMQAVLEPYSHEGVISMEDIGQAAVYGFAGGVGMGLGTGARSVDAQTKMYNQAKLAYRNLTGGAELTRTEFNSKSEAEQRAMASMSAIETEVANAAYNKYANEAATEVNAGTVGAVKLTDAIEAQRKQAMAKGTDRTDAPFVITPFEATDEFPSDAVVSSGRQLGINFTNRMRGVAIQLGPEDGSQEGSLHGQLARAAAEAAQNPQDPDAAQRVADLTKRVEQTKLMLAWGQRLEGVMAGYINSMYEATATIATRDADVAALNDVLARAFNRELNSFQGTALTDEDKQALARMVSSVATRDPQDQAGSYQIFMPQASARLTSANADNVLEISLAVLPALRGDYDGDKIRTQDQLMLDNQEFTNARAGMHFIGTTPSKGPAVNVKASKNETYNVQRMSEAIASGGVDATYATGVLTQIGDEIRQRYTGVVPDALIDEVLVSFYDAVHAGGKDARAKLLDGLADKAGGLLNEFARKNLSNEWLWIDRVVRSNLQQFQEIYAAHRPDIGPLPNTDAVLANKQSQNVRERKMARAATVGNTVALMFTGDSAFRKDQKLHYTSLVAAVLSATETNSNEAAYALAQLYEALGQGLTRSELDNVRGKDDITTRVYARLQRLALEAQRVNPDLNPVEAMTVMANLKVGDVDIAPDGATTPNGQEITLAQWLLRQSVNEDKRRNEKIIDVSPELQAKYRRLEGMTRMPKQGVPGSMGVNAQRAFVEVIGSQQLFALLGEDANVFGPHLSVEQFLRMYVSKSTRERQDIDNILKGEAAYLGRKSSKNMPYDLAEVASGEISPYRSVVDAIIATGHSRITIDKDGNLHGEYAERSDRTGKAFRTAHKRIREALLEYVGLSPRQEGELTADLIQRLIESDPDFSRQVMALIPNAAAPAVFRQVGNDTFMANWVYGLFALDNANEAEVSFWRHVMYAQWNAAGLDTRDEETEEGYEGRKYARIKRRMHRIMYNLHPDRAGDGGALLREFNDQVWAATSVEELIKWINTTPGVRGVDDAPITAWVDDTAEFDMDKAQGGWTTALEGAELREAVVNLKRGAENLVKDLAEERASLAADNQVLLGIQAVLKYDAGDTSVVIPPGAREAHDALQKQIDDAGELMLGLGPQQMIFQTVVAAMGFYAQGHTKGKNPEHVELEGAFDAMRDAIGYTTNYERVMAALTSVNLDALGANISMVAKDNVRSMDDDGRAVTANRPTVAQMVELLQNSDTRPGARAMLFPTVMERDYDGALRPKMLVGKSLVSLLNNSTHQDLFPKNDRLSLDSALRYVSMVEAQSRKFGGKPHALQRAVNDIVIAKTTAADHVLSFAELERITVETYHQVAEVLQATSSVGAESFQPGQDPLEEMLKEFKATQRRIRTASILGAELDDLTDDTIDTLVELRRKQAAEDAKLLTASLGGTKDPAEIERITQQIAGLKADTERFEQKVQLLRSDDLAGNVVQMFTIPPAGQADGKVKSSIVEYIFTHLKILERSSANLLTLNKLTNQMLDPAYGGQPKLNDKEWDELSRAVIAVYIDETVSSGGTSVLPFPDADHSDSWRYYDTSFSYLLDPLFDRNGPLVQAGIDVHRRAGRQMEHTYTNDVIQLVGRTIFKDFAYGQWTSDIPRNSIDANERLDSAAAAQAISMYGQSPKLQATVSAATRRTFKLPADEHFSDALLSYIDVVNAAKNPYDEVDIMMPTGAARRPLAQLNNRFARGVTATIDGQTVDLLAYDANLGRVWAGNEEAAGSGLQEIHLDRVRRAIDHFAASRGVSPAGAVVSIQFLHPDSQPVELDNQGLDLWMNNLWFEGTSFKLDADRHESLNATLWFAEGSLNPVGQATALDASKLGQSALKVVPVPTAAERESIEGGWRTDFAEMLRAKTRMMLESDLGTADKLEPEFYNAVYKNMKMRHFVKGVDPDGNVVLMTAEQVMAAQTAGIPLPTGAELWVPSDDVLRSFLGEQHGTQGVKRILTTDLQTDLALVPTYRGVTPDMLATFQAGITDAGVDVAKTRVFNRSRQQQLVVRGKMDEAQTKKYDARVQYHKELAEAARIDRALMYQNSEQGFSPKKNLKRALKAGKSMLFAENISLDWRRGGIPFIGPRIGGDTELSTRLLHELEAALAKKPGRTGWVFREGSEADTPRGMISEVSLGSNRPGLMVAPGDLVILELDGFNGDRDLAKKRIDYMTDRGAVVVLGETTGMSDMRAELAEYLQSSAYERIAGSKHVYVPSDTTKRYQNQKARASSMMEIRGLSQKSMISVFNVADKSIEENGAWVQPNNPRMADIAVTMNLMPVDALGGFNAPVEQFTNTSQIERVRAHIQGFDTKAGRTLLRDMHNGHITDAGQRATADAEFETRFNRLLERLANNPGTVLPQPGDEFGTGDFIPLIDGQSRVLLYSHGMKAPHREDLDSMLDATLPHSSDAQNVAIFPNKPEAAATTHTGTVVKTSPRSGYGMSIELNIPLQQFGDKKVLEWNGMKYLLTPMPDEIQLPDHPFFTNGWGVDLVASTHDMASKESFEGLVNNHRNAFAFFGIDFTEDVAKFFNTDARTALEILNTISRYAEKIPVEAADAILNSEVLPKSYARGLAAVAAQFSDLSPTPWVNRLGDTRSPESQIVTAIITYLHVSGTRVEDVIRSGGFNDSSSNPDAQSILMPRLFTQVFDNAELGSPLRTEINRRLNQQLSNPKKDGTGYSLAQDWTFETRNGDPKKNLRGFLQFAEAHSSGDNPIKNGMSFDDTARGAVSQHSGDIAYQATGADTAHKYDIARVRAFAEGKGIERFERDVVDGGVWRMLTGIKPNEVAAGKNHRAMGPAEAQRHSLGHDAVVQFRQDVDKKTDAWSDDQRKQAGDLARDIVHGLGLKDTQVGLVDYWVRQMLGMPHGTDVDGNPLGQVTGRGYIEAARDILWNVEHFYLPTVGAEVPLLHLHDLQLIYRTNLNRPKPWSPRESIDKRTTKADSWNAWTQISLGSALTSDNLFDPLYLLALDGFMYTYQSSTPALMDLPISIDTLKTFELMDPETNRLIISLDDKTDLIHNDQMMLDVARATVSDLVGGQRIAGVYKAKAAPASEVAKRRDYRRKWRKENGVPIPLDVTMRNFRKNGAEFVDTSTTTSALARGLINLRVGTALINPALYVSMGPEQWIRGTLDRSANLLTGQSTAGAMGALAAKMGLSQYSYETVRNISRATEDLGRRADFKRMIYGDLMYLRPVEPGIGKIERGLEAYAKLGSRLQDPTWGMSAKTLARRYVEAALQHINATPTLTSLTADRLAAELSLNPTFLRDHHPEAHQAATNAIAQLRSLKATPLSLTLRGIYEPLSSSTNSATNFLGNVVLKMPLLFSGYAMNVLTTITGMQGASDMFAMAIEGRKKGPGSFFGRIQYKLAGKEIPPEFEDRFDMSTVLEGIDLTRSFIRGGLSHTGLFMLGMMAGSLGLSGEDDEAKKRRKMAALQGAGFLYDPRQIENDFRNADAVFLDWLPGFDKYFKVTPGPDGKSMAQTHWMLKQFVSPIMGMERFLETGDFRQVTWGFEDALGSFPLINTLMWDDAVTTAHEFAKMADDEAKLGGPQNMVAASGLLANGVGVYERMLFENAFVNMLYTSLDRYDRNPYALPQRDSDGTIQRDIEEQPYSQDIALQSFLDPETGELVRGYESRDAASGALHALTENRATLAFAMSLFDGLGDSDYLRKNMVVKTREIEKETITQDAAEALIRLQLQKQGGLPSLVPEEIKGALIQRNIAAGVFQDPDKLEAEAAAIAANGGAAPMSYLDKSGREHLTIDGAEAIFRGLWKKSTGLDDLSLQGAYITYDMREAIAAKWTKELVQEGIELGLDQTKATSRMKRLMYGEFGTSQEGLADILFKKPEDGGLSYSDTMTYNQLNTTYVMGPDGRPWATGATRSGVLGALGLKPLNRYYVSETPNTTSTDTRLNTTDLINGVNTGLRALELVDESRYIPTDIEIGKAIEKAIEDAAKADYTPLTPFKKSGGGNGWVNYGNGGYGGYKRRSYGGGYSSGGNAYFTRMYSMPGSNLPYGNNTPMINTSNPITRRADIRRERVWSERGRLKQWQ